MTLETDINQKCIDAVRILSAQSITNANSGHPGICLGAAPVAYTLFAEFMNFSYKNPQWENRDRFVLSAGHGSALLYSLLHLFGMGVTKEDLASFRKFGSATPGHPEYGVTAGVDASTGPLGQGIANAVGLALAETHLAAKFNRAGHYIVNHYTYALCGDGCLEEGISYEACSFAGTQKLGKLILFYDKNDISIEGDTATAFSENTAMRFAAMGWQVIEVPNANDVKKIRAAIRDAQRETGKPSVIICRSVIGFGSPLAGSAEIHGSPLSEEQLKQTKDKLNWTEEPFEVPEAVRYNCKRLADEKCKAETEWNEAFKKYSAAYPELAKEYKNYFNGFVIDGSKKFTCEKPEATRISGGKVLNDLAKSIPNLLSGSADLSPSTKTDLKGEEWFSPENRLGRNIHFGIREHAMAAICNGIALHGGLKIVCSTFFTFSDYMKGAMRMSAIMKLPVIYVLTHDGIGVGEDGPTHQPVEQLAALRATPDVSVFRPCDYSETAAAYICALTGKQPAAIVLSRQNLTQYNKGENAMKGGYIIDDCKGNPDALLIATGSEVELCAQAKTILESKGVNTRVISLPCFELFEKQTEEYRASVIPKTVKARVCVETASPLGWREYAGDCGEIIAMTSFGLSGDYKTLYKHFGFTPENIAGKATISLKK